MDIRTAAVDDAEGIARVHVQSWQHAYREILPAEFLARLSVPRRQAMWAESIARGEPEVLIAKLDGRIVGFSAIGRCRDDGAPPTAFELWAIYLLPSHFSQGIGRSLWTASRTRLEGHGATQISLWVINGNERARRFYAAAGFVPEAGSVKPFELGGVTIEEIRYVRVGGAGGDGTGTRSAGPD